MDKNKIIDIITIIVSFIIIVDALGFVAWIMSGQVPTDNFYIGTITAHFIKLVKVVL